MYVNKFKTIDETQINQIDLGLLKENNVVYLGYFVNHHIEKNNLELLKTIFQKLTRFFMES